MHLLPTLALIGCLSSCATRIDSPREPFMIAESPAVARVAPDPGSEAFQVLDHWDWSQTVHGPAQVPNARRAPTEGRLGLHAAERFRLADGTCSDCPTPPAALWHFLGEVLAVPRPDVPAIGPARTPAAEQSLHPSVVWIGAPEVIERAGMRPDGLALAVDGEAVPLALPPRSPLDRSQLDHSTARFFSQRSLRLRGASVTGESGNTFVARTVWPRDSRIEKHSITLEPLRENELLSSLLDAQVIGTASAFPSRLLFDAERQSSSWAGKPVIAMVLSGAQGDDDSSSAGHVAVATGHFGRRGEWNDWLVENFYPHQATSVKGIISATLPMDNYLFDLNSGQLIYRPAYMLVAVLRRPDAAREIHIALHRKMLDYYCRRFDFEIASHNSTAMTMDQLRELGWRIPAAGPTSRVLGVLGAPIATVARMSFSAGQEFFHSMTIDTTRLLPRVAFEVAAHDLLYLVQARPPDRELTRLERMLVDDVEAVLFVRLPQVPSTRPYGTSPIRSLLQYGARVLAAPSEYETGPEGEALILPNRFERSCEQRQQTSAH